MEELNKPKVSITAIVVSAVLAAVVFGGGVYAYQSNKAKKDQEALKNQITTLETQKANLEKQVANTTSDTVTPSTPTNLQSSDTLAQGWVRKTITELNVAFDYPEKLGTFEYKIDTFTKDNGDGTGKTMTASIGGKAGSPSTSAVINLYAQSKDFTTGLGRGGGFLDLDGYEKKDNKFYIYTYNWVTGQKEQSFLAETLYNNPREVTTKNFTALLLDKKELDGPGGLQGDYGAIVPVQTISSYYAITVQSGDTKISADDFVNIVKSFRSTK